MARTRLQLHHELKKLSENCYFSPPNGFEMKYPCIVYKLEGHSNQHGDDIRYIHLDRYTVTVIVEEPNDDLPDRFFNAFEYCSLDRHFFSDNLSHYVYTLYY